MSDPGAVESFVVDLESGGADVRVAFSGDLDLAARGALVEAAERAVTSADGRRIVLDLSAVQRIDSTGLRDLIEAVLRCDQAEAEWELVSSDEVERLLVLVRFGRRRSDGGEGWVAGGGYTEE
ncbi:MAG TPA: STAS domain-containing protein [Gaiellales bacterium]|nr:STAS domain-containing protein [Gaiellales bacterium]